MASAYSSGTMIVSGSARPFSALPIFCTASIWLDFSTLRFATEGRSLELTFGRPRRLVMLATIEARSSVTSPPLTFTAPLPPLTIVTNAWSAR